MQLFLVAIRGEMPFGFKNWVSKRGVMQKCTYSQLYKFKPRNVKMAIINFRMVYLKCDGVASKLTHVFKYGVDNVVVFVSLQIAGSVFLEEVDEVVQQEVRTCNKMKYCYSHSLPLAMFSSIELFARSTRLISS